MPLLPDRYPNRDFFILDMAEVMPKDDLISMEHPIFSLSTKKQDRILNYESNGKKLRIIPSGEGLPTIFDKDILIFCISKLIHQKNRGEPISKKVVFNAHELMTATNRDSSGTGYKRLEEAFIRLRGLTFNTNIKAKDGKTRNSTFGIVDQATFITDDARGRKKLEMCEVVLSDWMMETVEAAAVTTISPRYFRIRRPLERRIYELARKHCGYQKRWHINLKNLQSKAGSKSALKHFRATVNAIIQENETPDYWFELTTEDLFIVRPRKTLVLLDAKIKIKDWAEAQGKEIAIEKGWDYEALKGKYRDYAHHMISIGKPAEDHSKAFIGYCKKQDKLR